MQWMVHDCLIYYSVIEKLKKVDANLFLFKDRRQISLLILNEFKQI